MISKWTAGLMAILRLRATIVFAFAFSCPFLCPFARAGHPRTRVLGLSKEEPGRGGTPEKQNIPTEFYLPAFGRESS
jgi:hypothetical protein